MEKSSRTSEWLLLGLSVMPLLYLLLIWPGLPDRVPTHFDIDGHPNGYSSKQGLATGIIISVVLIYGLLRSLPALDPTNSLQSASYGRIRLLLTLFLSGMTVLILYIVHSRQTGDIVSDLILSAVFLLFAGIGNVMLTVPRNYFVGIKTPWALASETNWRKTHRLAGKLWFVGGLAAFLLSFFLPPMAKLVLTLGTTALLAIVPYVYSYRLYKQGVTTILLLLLTALYGQAQAQTEEALRYDITQPTGLSLTLEGTLTLPANLNQKTPVVLLIAGSGSVDRDGNSSGMVMNMYRQLADSLARRGVATLRYDKRGSGANLMSYVGQLGKAPLNFDYIVADAAGLIRRLKADRRFSRVVVAGHSEGSLVGMLAAAQAGADRYVSIAGAGQNIAGVLKEQFANGGVTGEGLALASRDLDSLKAGLTVQRPYPLVASLFTPPNQAYLISWMKYDPAVAIRQVKGPILLLQGKRDIQVPVAEAERLKAARPDAQLVLFDTMNHVLKTGPADRMGNMASYTAPGSTILPAVADTLADFAKK